MRTLLMATTVATLAACRCLTPVDTSTEARVLLGADRAFAAMSADTDPKTAFAAFMAPDAMMLPAASAGAIEGYGNVIAAFGEGDDPGYRLLWQPQFAEVARAGDLGWTWGQFQVIADGEPLRTGKYVNVWKRQADGSWKVRVDIGNQRPPE